MSALLTWSQLAGPDALRNAAPGRARLETMSRPIAELGRRGLPGDAPATAAFVPGRIEVMGKHTDYCGGRSLLCAVDRGFSFVAVRRPGTAVRITSVDTGEHIEAALGADLALKPGHWSNYILTTLRRAARNFPMDWAGCDIAFSSDLPPAAGLSSSSALIIATFLAVARLNRLETHPAYRENIRNHEDLANFLGCIENGSSFRGLAGDRGVGTFGGSQDHTAILCGQADAIVQYRFGPVAREAVIPLPSDFRFVVANSGVRAEKTGSALEKYNAVSLRVRRLVDMWNTSHGDEAATLRDVLSRPSAADGLVRLIPEREPDAAQQELLLQRLDQYQRESDALIPAAAEALRAGDWVAFGRVVDESQHLAETQLHNQVPGTIALHRALREGGALAASAFGAGFGGSVWGLAPDEASALRLVEAVKPLGEAFVTRAAAPAWIA